MATSLLDGNQASFYFQQTIRAQVDELLARGENPPGLAVILVGGDPASAIYVKNKRKACKVVGFNSYDYDLPASTSTKELLLLIEKLNQSDEVNGILVQLPLPGHIETHQILEAIHPNKDVDGFHPYNIGRLALANPSLRPCTPYGIIKLLSYYQIPLRGKNAVVIGASNIVGRPMALEFLLVGATVTICHRSTKELSSHVKSADIIVVATGVPDLISTEWLNADQILVDVGIHRLANGKLRGDVNFAEASKKVAWITPVPGGVGPMTITTLLENTAFAKMKLEV